MGKWHRALVTGASSGIGEAFARELAHQGTHLVLVARREGRLERLAGQLRSQGVEAEVIVADLLRPEDRLVVEKRLDADDAPVDLLVNNAGGHRVIAPFIEQTRDDIESDALLNACAVLRLTHAAAQAMARR